MVLEVGAGGHAHEDEAAAAEDEAGATEDEAAAAEDTATDPLVITALVVGGLGLIAGGTALVVNRRKG
jgi:poly-gamma-glutamate capsule biosynthesis protein CapA/YwtB (metallophosphatase superfamily)